MKKPLKKFELFCLFHWKKYDISIVKKWAWEELVMVETVTGEDTYRVSVVRTVRSLYPV